MCKFNQILWINQPNNVVGSFKIFLNQFIGSVWSHRAIVDSTLHVWEGVGIRFFSVYYTLHLRWQNRPKYTKIDKRHSGRVLYLRGFSIKLTCIKQIQCTLASFRSCHLTLELVPPSPGCSLPLSLSLSGAPHCDPAKHLARVLSAVRIGGAMSLLGGSLTLVTTGYFGLGFAMLLA